MKYEALFGVKVVITFENDICKFQGMPLRVNPHSTVETIS